MKITITHFKCYYGTVTYDFPQYKLSLLHSNSGSGKSTIFVAIMWCLYGTVQKIKPDKSSTAKDTSVIVEFPEYQNLKITRTLSKFEIILNNGNILIGDNAQGYIDNIFGHKTLWVASTYMHQIEPNSLLTSSNYDRFKLLHELTYGSEADLEINNPDFYLDKCDNLIAQTKTAIDIETGKFNVLKENYCQFFNANANIINSWPNNIPYENVSIFSSDKQKFIEHNLKLSNELISIRNIESKINTINTLINSTNDKINSISYRNIDEIQKELDNYEAQVTLLNKLKLIESLQKQLKDLGNIPENYLERLPKAQQELNDILNFNNICLNEGFHPSQLKEEILKYEKEITLEGLYNNWKNEMEIYNKEYQEQNLIIETKWLQDCNDEQQKYNFYIQKRKEIENHNFNLTSEYNLKCDIKNKKQQEYQRNLKIYEEEKNKIDTIRNEYEKIKPNYEMCVQWWKTNFNSDITITNIENKISEYNMLLEELICPHCNNGVTYSNKTLLKGHSDIKTRELAKEQIINIKNIYEIFKFYEQINKKYNEINKNLDIPIPPSPTIYAQPQLLDLPPNINLILPPKPKIDIKIPIEPRKPLSNSKLKYEKLKSLIPPINDINELKKEIEILNKGYEYTKIKTQLEGLGIIEIPLNSNEILNKVSELQKELLLSRQKEIEKKSLFESIMELQNTLPEKPIKNSETIIEEINKNNENVKILEGYITAGNLILKINQDRMVVENLHNYILQLSTYQNNIEKVKQIINEVSSSSLEDTVKNITYNTNLILKEIFNKDIAISLNTHKELKNSKIKLQVNIQIFYRNTIYEFPEVSPGEQDRISIALTLAISKLSNSPFIFIDETLKFVEENLREKILELIKEQFKNKTIIHVSHSCIEGLHDEILTVKY